MDIKDIFDLWDRFENSDSCEMVLDFQGTHFFLKKAADGPGRQVNLISGKERKSVSDCQVADGDKGEGPGQGKIDKEAEKEKSGKEIKAPLVGTFYQAGGPDEEPYVKVGQRVNKGDVIGIIEAMKLMNEVTASHEGIVDEILVGDGEFVEFHQTLIRLR